MDRCFESTNRRIILFTRLVFILLISFALVCNVVDCYDVAPSGVFAGFDQLTERQQKELSGVNNILVTTQDGRRFTTPQLGFPISRPALTILAQHFNSLVPPEIRAKISITVEAVRTPESNTIHLLIGSSSRVYPDGSLQVNIADMPDFEARANEILKAMKATWNEHYEVPFGFTLGEIWYAKPQVRPGAQPPERYIVPHSEQGTAAAGDDFDLLRVHELPVRRKVRRGNPPSDFVRTQIGSTSDRPPCTGCRSHQKQTSDHSFFPLRIPRDDFNLFRTILADDQASGRANELALELVRQAYGQTDHISQNDLPTLGQPSLAGQFYIQSFHYNNAIERTGLLKISTTFSYELRGLTIPLVLEPEPDSEPQRALKTTKNLVMNNLAVRIRDQSLNSFPATVDIHDNLKPMRMFLYAVAGHSLNRGDSPPHFPELDSLNEVQRNDIFRTAHAQLTEIFRNSGLQQSFDAHLNHLYNDQYRPTFEPLNTNDPTALNENDFRTGSPVIVDRLDFQSLFSDLFRPAVVDARAHSTHRQTYLETWKNNEVQRRQSRMQSQQGNNPRNGRPSQQVANAGNGRQPQQVANAGNGRQPQQVANAGNGRQRSQRGANAGNGRHRSQQGANAGNGRHRSQQGANAGNGRQPQQSNTR